MPSSGRDHHLPRHLHRFHRPLGARKLASPQVMRAETCPRTKQARRRADGTAGRAQRLDGADRNEIPGTMTTGSCRGVSPAGAIAWD